MFFHRACIYNGRGNGETVDKIENIRQIQSLVRIALWISFQLNQFAESAHFAVVWWHEPRGWNPTSLELDSRLRYRVGMPLLWYNIVEERDKQLWGYRLSE